MTGRLPYMSEAWFGMLENEARRAVSLAAKQGLTRNFVLLERYLDAPDIGLRDGLEAGFRIEFFENGEVRLTRGVSPDDEADCVFTLDWPAAFLVASQLSGEGLESLITELCSAGRATITGDLRDCPVDLDAFHDAVVNRTCSPVAVSSA